MSSLERLHGATPMLGYLSVDVEHEADPTGEFRRQAKEIASECERRGLSLLGLVRDREPRRGPPLRRPGLGYTLQRIFAGEAQGLLVADLSRLTHSVAELGRLFQFFLGSDVRLIVAVPALDTAEAAGLQTVQTVVEISRWERERLVARTRNGMLAARHKGPRRAVADYPELMERIARMRADGLTLQAIADQLNAEGVPTMRGGIKWRPSSVQAATGYHRPAPRGTAGSPLDVPVAALPPPEEARSNVVPAYRPAPIHRDGAGGQRLRPGATFIPRKPGRGERDRPPNALQDGIF